MLSAADLGHTEGFRAAEKLHICGLEVTKEGYYIKKKKAPTVVPAP